MSNICLKIGVAATKEQALNALNTIEGLSKWWTSETSGETSEGGVIFFRFGEGGLDMKVTNNTSEGVAWECVAGPDEWLGTEVSFTLKNEDETVIYFQHKGWKEETPFHHHCSMKWATFLLSLKQYLDQGEGQPFPNDQKISTVA